MIKYIQQSLLLFLFILFAGCTENTAGTSTPQIEGNWDATPKILTPKASAEQVKQNQVAIIDYSNASQGYVIVQYVGTNPKVKLQITGPDQVTYTYNLKSGQEIIPLTAQNGQYTINIYENISGSSYILALAHTIEVQLDNEFLPFLYPNKYVLFNENSTCVKEAQTLATGAHNELEVVSNIYFYIIKAMEYDYDKAETLQAGYSPDVDQVLKEGKGICFDFAAVMCAMLRSQGIPTRMDVGYAGTIYHAWLSVYSYEHGWINGIIQFDGNQWELMDPTNAGITGNSKEFLAFLKDTSNYQTKFRY